MSNNPTPIKVLIVCLFVCLLIVIYKTFLPASSCKILFRYTDYGNNDISDYSIVSVVGTACGISNQDQNFDLESKTRYTFSAQFSQGDRSPSLATKLVAF